MSNGLSTILPVAGAAIGTIYGGQTQMGWEAGAAAGAALGGAAGAAVAEKPKIPLPPVTPMPNPDQIEAARRKTLEEQFARRGRASTILTGPGSSNNLSGL